MSTNHTNIDPNKDKKNPSLYYGSKNNYEWKYAISFYQLGENTYVRYSFDYPSKKIHVPDTDFKEAHISLLKKPAILNKLAELVKGAKERD